MGVRNVAEFIGNRTNVCLYSTEAGSCGSVSHYSTKLWGTSDHIYSAIFITTSGDLISAVMFPRGHCKYTGSMVTGIGILAASVRNKMWWPGWQSGATLVIKSRMRQAVKYVSGTMLFEHAMVIES